MMNVTDFAESKAEVLSIITCALESLEREDNDNRFCCPNDSVWSSEEIKQFLREFLRA